MQPMVGHKPDRNIESEDLTMEAKLIKIDRNGSKHYEGKVTCDRCGGRGLYAIGTLNGQPLITTVDNGICHKCLGTGWVIEKWIERTPEYQAKLDARREAKWQAKQAERDAKQAEINAEAEAEKELLDRLAQIREEERQAEEARKATSQYLCQIGDKIDMVVTYKKCAWYDRPSFSGYGTETCYIHTFEDTMGNILVWKTTSSLYEIKEGDTVSLKGTVKAHDEYKGEKQTQLQRCKVEVLQKVKELTEAEKKAEQLASIKDGDLLWTLPYRQYKDYYEDCETIVGSYDENRRTIDVIIRAGRLVPSGTRGKHFSGYELTNELGKHICYCAICEENALKRASKEFPENTWTCTKIYNYH